MPPPRLTNEIIIAAITGFESQKTRIDAQIAELRAMLNGDRPEPVATPEAQKGKRRKMSVAARKRIAEAQRKRWAASKGQAKSESPAVTPEPAKPKRRLSAAGKAAIVAALQKRLAAKKAAKAAPATTKKTIAKKRQGKASKSQKIAPAA
jgi:hypothetical protein